MKKLTPIEIQVIDKFNIKPTNIQMAEEDEWMPDLGEVVEFCMHQGYSVVYDKLSAHSFLIHLAEKICDIEDAISIEDLAIWILSHYFNIEQLKAMSDASALKFLKDWKYFFGFRKADEYDAAQYKWLAINYLAGSIEEVGDDEYFYKTKDEN